MTVSVYAGANDPTHSISLSDGSTTYGFIFERNLPRVLQEIPLSPPAQEFNINQKSWIGGRGRLRYTDDPTGYFDGHHLWSTTEGKIFPVPQWRFAQGMRNRDEILPDDNSTHVWWKLYGNTPASQIARYLTTIFTAGSSYNADKAFMWIRRRGTPGTLTFELCADGTGKPGTVSATVTKTVSVITDTVSVFQNFNWTGTVALTSGTNYYLKIYGASSDDATNHWEVMCVNTDIGLYSADNSTWAAAGVRPYFRVVDADTVRRWYMWMHKGLMYAVSNEATSTLLMNGVRGTSTSGNATSLTDTNLTTTADRWIGAYLRVIDGTGDGNIAQITDNTTNSFTVAVGAGTGSQYVVYGTPWFTAITGTPGLGKVVGCPISANKVVYFPQGQSVNIRRMQVNATSHDFAADGTNRADILYLSADPATGALVWSAASSSSTVNSSAPKTWGNDLVFGTALPVASSEWKILNFLDYNTLYIFKEDGLYSLTSGKLKKIGVSFDDVPDPQNGLAVTTDNNGYLWFSWANSLIRGLGSSFTDMLNWRSGYEPMPADRRGTPFKAVNACGWLFFALNGGADKYSSVIMWNGMGWCEVFRSWAVNVPIRNIFWQPCPETRGRLWIDVDGELVYIEFPFNTSHPLKDSTLNYQHEAVLVSPTYDAGDPTLYKIFHKLRLIIEAGTVDIDYQTDLNVGTDTWTYLYTASTTAVTDTLVNLGAKLQIRFRLRLQTANSRTPAIVSGLQLDGRMMPPTKYQYIGSFRMEAGSDVVDLTDQPDVSANDVYAQLKTWASQQTKLTMRSLDPSKDNKIGTITLPAKVVDWIDPDESSWSGVVSFAFLEA